MGVTFHRITMSQRRDLFGFCDIPIFQTYWLQLHNCLITNDIEALQRKLKYFKNSRSSDKVTGV